ncbi:MAG: hypothetical protein AVDCRST_MAG32-2652, partial [uncultured Nocardioides sp.]
PHPRPHLPPHPRQARPGPLHQAHV